MADMEILLTGYEARKYDLVKSKAERLDDVIAECEGIIFRTGIAIPNTATEAAKMLLDTAKGENDET